MIRSQGTALPTPVHIPRNQPTNRFSFTNSFKRRNSNASGGSIGSLSISSMHSSSSNLSVGNSNHLSTSSGVKRFSTRRGTLTGVNESETSTTTATATATSSSSSMEHEMVNIQHGLKRNSSRNSNRSSMKTFNEENNIKENDEENGGDDGDSSSDNVTTNTNNNDNNNGYVPVSAFGKEWKGETLRNSSVHHRFLTATGFLSNQNDTRFKTSVAKKTPIISLIPINCMIHTTLLRKIKSSQLEIEHGLCDCGEEITINVKSLNILKLYTAVHIESKKIYIYIYK